MIEKIVTINLKRREDKWWFALGTYRQQRIPFGGDSAPWGDTIVRFEAHDGREYADLDAIRTAAIADGFPHFDRMLDDNAPRGELALCWSWASALRFIIELDTTALFLYDDYSLLPHWDWDRVSQLVRELADTHPFKLMQLRPWDFASEFTPQREMFSSNIGHGIGGCCDTCVILNREGAELLFDASIESKHSINKDVLGPPPDAYRTMRKLGESDTRYCEGVYHTLECIADVTMMQWSSDLYD